MKTSAQKKNASSFKNGENLHEDIEEKPATLGDKVVTGIFCAIGAYLLSGVSGYFLYTIFTEFNFSNYFLIIPPIASYFICCYTFNNFWEFNRKNGFKQVHCDCSCHRNSFIDNQYHTTRTASTSSPPTHTGDFYDPSDISSYTHPAGVNYHGRHY